MVLKGLKAALWLCIHMHVHWNADVVLRIYMYLFEGVHLGIEVRDVEHPVGSVQPQFVDGDDSVPHTTPHHQSLDRLEQIAHTVHLGEAGEKEAGEKEAGEKGAGEKEAGEKEAGEKEAGEKGAGEKEAGEKGAGEKEAGEKEAGEEEAGEGRTMTYSLLSQMWTPFPSMLDRAAVCVPLCL